jgi:hypothetical protein
VGFLAGFEQINYLIFIMNQQKHHHKKRRRKSNGFGLHQMLLRCLYKFVQIKRLMLVTGIGSFGSLRR